MHMPRRSLDRIFRLPRCLLGGERRGEFRSASFAGDDCRRRKAGHQLGHPGLLQPRQTGISVSLSLVPSDALPCRIAAGQIRLSVRKSLIGGESIPIDRQLSVRDDGSSDIMTDSEVILGIRVPLASLRRSE